jgi:MFS family permease
VPLYLQVTGHSATDAGIRLLTSPVGLSVSSIGSGYIMKRTGRYVTLGITLVLAVVAGVAILSTLNEATPAWVTSVALLFIGGGHGGMLTVSLLACIAAVDHQYQAVITSATCESSPPEFLTTSNLNTRLDLARSLGATIGITIGSAVYQNILKERLWERFGDEPGAAERIGRIRDDLDELKHLPPGWQEGVMSSFMEAFRGVWLTMLGLSILALICISLMRQHVLHNSLDRK